MAEISLAILLFALVADWIFGEPDILWSRVPHPVVMFGKAVEVAERNLHNLSDSDTVKYRKGSLAVTLLIGGSVVFGLVLDWLFSWFGILGYVVEIFAVFVLLAQRSLYQHVSAVEDGLREEGLSGGREAVAMIVGRDPESLDNSGVSRAAIESLAENYSDGVVAPAFWYVVFGLPGILVYKMINTSDSMIAYKNDRYLWFGKTAAQIDDLANWIPARLSALLIAVAAGVVAGVVRAKQSFSCAVRDSGLHRSPNAGWPESAMAGAIDVALGGARNYGEEQIAQPHLNASGQIDLGPDEIAGALHVFAYACFVLWATVVVLLILA